MPGGWCPTSRKNWASSSAVRNQAWPAVLAQGLLLLLVGAVGALIGHYTGLPAGIIVGALVATGLYRLAGGEPGPWRGRYGRIGRLLLGTVIGAAFGPDVLMPLRSALLPTAGIVIAIVAIGLALGWLLGRLTVLDPATGIISAMPGGLPAMAALAEERDADATVVATIHFTRLTTILLFVPILIRLLSSTLTDTVAVTTMGEPAGWGVALITLAVGLLAGLVAVKLKIPSGDLVAPIVVLGSINLLGGGLGPMPEVFRWAAMLFIGISVGAQMSQESLRKLRQVAVPALLMVATLIAAGILLGWGLSLVTSLDLTTALLSAVPGGASTMPIIAHDLGGDFRLVAALQLVRQLVMLVVVPTVLGYVLNARRRKHIVASNL